MKKTLTIIILCIVFVLIYLLQINLFSWFTIAGVKPNMFIIFILFIGMYSGRRYGLVMGAIFGFLIEVLGSDIVGIGTLEFALIGFLRRVFR